MPYHLVGRRRKRMMWWLLLLVSVAGWWNSIDSALSIASRLGEVRWEEGLTPRQKLEFTGRVVRGIFGLILVLTAFFLALGA